MSLAEIVATETANKYLASFAQDLEIQDRLLRWQQIYNTTLYAIKLYDGLLREQRQEARAEASLN